MKNRLLTNWNGRRILYTALGGIVIVHSIIAGEWAGILFGAYFASMGIFAFGCAAGNCGVSYSARPSTRQVIVDAEFEEVK